MSSLGRENLVTTHFSEAYGSAAQGYHGLVLQDSQLFSAGQTFAIRGVQLGAAKQRCPDVYVAAAQRSPITGARRFSRTSRTGLVTSIPAIRQLPLIPTDICFHRLMGTRFTPFTSPCMARPHPSPPSVPAGEDQGSYYTAVVYDSPTGSASPTSVVVLNDLRFVP